MNTPISHDPAKVRTADGAVWVRAAVTTAGRGLYSLEGVAGCPRHVLATLPELAVHGVQVVVDELVDAVALLGALPMPVGDVHPTHPAPCRVPASPDCTCPASADDRLTESVAKLRGLLARQSGGAL